MKLAEALLLRKELMQKVEQIRPIKLAGDNQNLFELKFERRSVNEKAGIEELVVQVPKVSLSQITEEYDFYARHLRRLDAKIQEANWQTDIEYSEPQFEIKPK